MNKYIALLGFTLTACGGVESLVEPNTYNKCSDYSLTVNRAISLEPEPDKIGIDTVVVMNYLGKSVRLTDVQIGRLTHDPKGVCLEVM